MLTSLRIQNFRSIRDATVKLGKVNLFIGPNNSGKSNFLKGIKFASDFSRNKTYSHDYFDQVLTRKYYNSYKSDNESKENQIEFTAYFDFKLPNIIPVSSLIFNHDGLSLKDHTHVTDEKTSFKNLDENIIKILNKTQYLLENLIYNIDIYKIDPEKIYLSNKLSYDKKFESNGYNLTNFLFYLSQNHKNIFNRIENDFSQCINTLTHISTPADPEINGNLKLKLFDQNDIGYWAEEVSEGVLYFLALLCIIHQPDPPKLLLLEEPEKGIHPRRIKEVMDFIFELAELRDIQIILTSHSPYVVDHFADIPECISVFDRENGETVIRNAGGLITETNVALEAEGKKPIRYTDALGEHWVSGFLGGVPA